MSIYITILINRSYMLLFAFVRGFRIRKDKIPYQDIKRLIRANRWAKWGVCKMALKHLEVLREIELETTKEMNIENTKKRKSLKRN